MNQADLRELRNPLLVLAAVLAIGATAIYFSARLVASTDDQLVQQRAQLREARTRVQKSGDEKNLIVRYVDDYLRLQRAGFIGDEQRINWLDALRVANQQADLFGVDYQIGTQSAYPYAAELNPGDLTLSQSRMQLRFQLLHEEDLMRFLSALRQQGGGIFSIDFCQLRRNDTRGIIRFQPNISATCDLSWITARVGDAARKPR
jgi:hypothetical protein